MASSPEEAVTAVLADQAAQLRAQYPDLYAHVDEILNDPDRPIISENPPVFDDAWDTYHVRECVACGDNFYVAQPTRPTATCSNSCRSWYVHWRKRRTRTRES